MNPYGKKRTGFAIKNGVAYEILDVRDKYGKTEYYLQGFKYWHPAWMVDSVEVSNTIDLRVEETMDESIKVDDVISYNKLVELVSSLQFEIVKLKAKMKVFELMVDGKNGEKEDWSELQKIVSKRTEGDTSLFTDTSISLETAYEYAKDRRKTMGLDKWD